MGKRNYTYWLTIIYITVFISLPVNSRAASQQTDDDISKISASEAPIKTQTDIDAEDQQALQNLLSVLEEETKIATKTKMNSDYVPGIVTVLHGDQLEALGIKTVAEALSLVPGIQVARIASGEPTVKVRGLTYPFNAGNIKVMLNSIALSRESSGINSSVLLIPVTQIDRVEVIRGPGSSVYGNFAMAGVVNIITKSSGGRLYAQGGDDESLAGGGHYSYQNKEKTLNVGLSLSMADDGESATRIDSKPEEERSAGVFHLDYRNFSFKIEGVKRSADYEKLPPRSSLAGESSSLTSPDPPKPLPQSLSTDERSWAAEARQRLMLGSAGLEIYLSYLSNEADMSEPDRSFNGNRVETGFEIDWTPLTGHQFLFGFSYADSNIDNAHDANLSISDIGRRNYSLTVQDQLTLFERLSLTLGIRYDDYDDVGTLLTPRIAGVYRLGENHVLKAQYSQGFRSPTFWELYRTGKVNDDLDFEIIDTFEATYIYRQPGAVGRVTLYYSKIDNGIFSEGDQIFTNVKDIESKGAEIEWEQKITEKLRLLANVSYIKTDDERWSEQGSDDSPGVANWLSNLAFFFEPLPKLMVTGRWLHVGDQYSTDGNVDGYDTVDLTLSRRDLFLKRLSLKGGVKNIFNDTVIYTTKRPHNFTEDEFQGRSFWVQLSYEF